MTDWESRVWCKSQFAEAMKWQNLSQVDDSISVEGIISVKGINRGYAKRLSLSTPPTEAEDKVAYVPMKKAIPGLRWLRSSPRDWEAMLRVAPSDTNTGLQTRRSPRRKVFTLPL